MRGTWGLGVALVVVLALQLPAAGTLGMRVSELERSYSWEPGPEGTRLYQIGDVFFSPFIENGRMVGAIAELPPGSGSADIAALLARMTAGLRQVPAAQRGTVASNSWDLLTPDYHAMAMTENGKIFVLVQQRDVPQRDGRQSEQVPSENTIDNPVFRAQNDLEILRMALESYRARHWFSYPEVSNVDALMLALERSEVLPAGFRLRAPLTEFGVWRTGYRISVLAGGKALTIRQPDRPEAFWSFLQLRPFP